LINILFSPPSQNLLLQSSFSASLVPHPIPAQRLRFGWSTADIVHFTNSFTYLLTYFSRKLTHKQYALATATQYNTGSHS